MKLHNRRYTGCKFKLLDDISDVLSNYPSDKYPVFFDAFAGTGVVSQMALDLGYEVIVNDNLYSNYVVYQSFFSKSKIDYAKLNNLVKKIERKRKSKDSYLSRIYGDKYFTVEECEKIQIIRETIEENKSELNKREYFLMIASLLYSVDRIANTVGHYEHYLSTKQNKRQFEFELLDVGSGGKAKIFCEDTNKLVKRKKIKCDILYLDPPYNARQYINFYHVLENIARWEKPEEFEGKSMKFKREELKSEYSRSNAFFHLKELINNVDSKVILISYNNTYNAKSGASNNKIKEEELVDFLKSTGDLKVVEKDYKPFQTGKTDLKNHKEKMFICVR